MDQNRFVALRPFLYHLTDQDNYPNIMKTKRIFSTKEIVENSDIENKQSFLRTRRASHIQISSNDFEYKIRDQKPVSITALSKNLTNGWSTGDFIEHVNKRIFFWCQLDRLNRHFKTYEIENPIILRFYSKDIIGLNGNAVEYCRLNSGATRPSSHWGGLIPHRGPRTFLQSDKYTRTPGTVVEVTVVGHCDLPNEGFIAVNPEGPWDSIRL